MLMSKDPASPILLDTHIWIWLMTGDKQAGSSKLLALITEKAKHSAIRISVISVWEIGMLESKGRIVLPYSCLEWVQKALQAPGFGLENLTPEIAVQSSRLPGVFHGDPADRILLATAARLRATLVTRDQKILHYLKKHPLAESFLF